MENYDSVSRLIGAQPLKAAERGEPGFRSEAEGASPGAQIRPVEEPTGKRGGSGTIQVKAEPEKDQTGAPVVIGGSQVRFPGPVASTPFVDDRGKPILNQNGMQMFRPNGWDAHYFTREGKRVAADVPQTDDNATSRIPDPYEGAAPELLKFRQFGPWDAQRIGGRFRGEFKDFATVAIGLYAVSSGLSIGFVLEAENLYAASKSHFPPETVMDRDYRNLPARNVWNTRLGYELYESGRLR